MSPKSHQQISVFSTEGGQKQRVVPGDERRSGASAVRGGAQVCSAVKRLLQVDRLRSPGSGHTHGGGNLP